MRRYLKFGLKRNVNESPEFCQAKHGNARMWVERSLSSPSMLHALANVDAMLARPECVIIKDERKIRIGRVPLSAADGSTPVYIKRYNCFSLRYRIQSLLARSGAVRSLRGAAILRETQIATARPVAAVEVRRWGMLESSFYISEEITAARTVDAYWREKLRILVGPSGFRARRRFLTGLSRLFQRLHAARVYHNDLKDFNILVHADGGAEEFFLVDLEGVRRCHYLSARRRIKNLVQLNRTLGSLLTRTEKVNFLKSYLTGESSSHKALARWVTRILAAGRRAERSPVAGRRLLQKRRAADPTAQKKP
jgi:tRNA A-37 threonylcarbamoyl transferase component Bud32